MKFPAKFEVVGGGRRGGGGGEIARQGRSFDSSESCVDCVGCRSMRLGLCTASVVFTRLPTQPIQYPRQPLPSVKLPIRATTSDDNTPQLAEM